MSHKFQRPVTSLTFVAGEPAWSLAVSHAFSCIFYVAALVAWLASGSSTVGLMGLAASLSLTPLPPLYALRWLIRKLRTKPGRQAGLFNFSC